MASAPHAPSSQGTRFPIPLVGAAVILVMLTIMTPVLVTGGGGAGALLAQADLVVDHPGNSVTTYFYVRGVGVVRYAEIQIGLNEDFVPGTPVGNLTWTSWTNVSDQISLSIRTNYSQVAVNVSVYYIPTSGPGVWYYGILGSVYAPFAQTITLTSLAGGLATPSGAISTTNGHRLPVVIALAYQGSVGAPP